MTIPLWCLVMVALMPFGLAGMGGAYRRRQFGVMDNQHPRLQAAKLEGAGARVWAAQQNAWEALIFFTAVVFVAHSAGADAERSAIAAMVFVLTRLAHAAFYIANMAVLRSAVFVIGLLSGLYMIGLAAAVGGAP
jgi:uncharacterized MAPEG superfamily protein